MFRRTVTSVLGAQYELQHRDRLQLASYSHCFYTWDGVTVPLRSTDHMTAWFTATTVLGATFDEEYDLGDGTLYLGSYAHVASDNGVNYSNPSVALWSGADRAVWTETEVRDTAWLVGLFQHLEPKIIGETAVVSGADLSMAEVTDEEVLTTILSGPWPGSDRILRLFDLEAWAPTSRRGMDAEAGELFRRGDEAVLRGVNAMVQVREADFGSTGSVDFLRRFGGLDRARVR